MNRDEITKRARELAQDPTMARYMLLCALEALDLVQLGDVVDRANEWTEHPARDGGYLELVVERWGSRGQLAAERHRAATLDR